MAGRRRRTDDDFQAQLDTIEELASIDHRLRWLAREGVERFLGEKRRMELIRHIVARNRRFAAVPHDRGAERGA